MEAPLRRGAAKNTVLPFSSAPKRCDTSEGLATSSMLQRLNLKQGESSGELFLHLAHTYRTESTQAWQAKNTGAPAALTTVHKPESASQERTAEKSTSSCPTAQ